MTKLPEVGKRYRRIEFIPNSLLNEIEVTGFKADNDGDWILIKNGMINADLFERYEELPEEKEDNRMTNYCDKCGQIYLEEDFLKHPCKKDKVQVAIEELKREICLYGGGVNPCPQTEEEKKMRNIFFYFLGKAQDLVNALEDKQEQKPAMSNNSLEERIERLEKRFLSLEENFQGNVSCLNEIFVDIANRVNKNTGN